MAWKKSRAFFSVTSIGARVYLAALTTRNTKALGGLPNAITDELGDVAAVPVGRLELPRAEEESENVECASDPLVPLVVPVVWELVLLKVLGGRPGGSLLSGN